MKKHSYIRAALSVAIAGVSALVANIALAAPKPVVIWDGDFTSLEKSGYAINLNGHVVSEDGKYITIGSGTNGVEIDWSTGISAATVVFKCENVPTDYVPGKNQCFATIRNSSDLNRVGMTRRGTDGKGQAIWSNTLWGSSPTPEFTTVEEEMRFGLAYNYNTGTLFCAGDGKQMQTLLDSSGLGSPNFDANSLKGFSLLGYRGSSSNMITLEGARITGIAIFTSKLTAAEIATVFAAPYVPALGDTINLNFANNNSSFAVAQETLNGAIPPEAWSMKLGPSGNGIAGVKVYSAAGEALDYSSMVCTWYYNIMGWGTSVASLSGSDGDTLPDATHAYMKDFFVRGELQKTQEVVAYSDAHIQLSGIPFYKYDLYVYFNGSLYSDKTTMSAFELNGTRYTVNGGGVPISGTDDWGRIGKGEPILGDNVVKFTGRMDSSLAFYYNGHVRRMGIAAIQIVNRTESVVMKLDGDKAWSELWLDQPEPEDGEVVLQVDGDCQLNLDQALTCGKVLIVGRGDITVVAKSRLLLAAMMGKFAGSELNGKVTFEFNVRDGYEADDAFKEAVRSADSGIRFVFKGAGENGVTLDYGGTYLNTTLGTHLVFDGGKHTLQMRNEASGLKFGANAAPDNPTLRVTGGAYLVFNARNICGWDSGASNANGIIRVDDGSTAEIIPTAGTCYWAQQIYLEPGATLAINDNGTNFRVNGGTGSGDTAQFYVPNSVSDATDKPAIIKQLGTGGLYVNGQGTKNMAVYVGANSRLILDTNLGPDQGGNQVTKYGAGILEASDGKLTDIPTWQLSGGTLAYNGQLTTVNLNGATLSGNGEKATVIGTLHTAGSSPSTVKDVVFSGSAFQFGNSGTRLIADGFEYSPAETIPTTNSGVIEVKDLKIDDDQGLPSAVGLDVNSDDGILRLLTTEWETGRKLCGGTLSAPSGKVKRTIYLGDKAYKTKVLFDTSAKTIKAFKPGLLFFVQ